jgi:hypothetical protein
MPSEATGAAETRPLVVKWCVGGGKGGDVATEAACCFIGLCLPSTVLGAVYVERAPVWGPVLQFTFWVGFF